MYVEGLPSATAGLSQDALATRWGVSIRLIKSETAAKRIPHLRIGGRVIYPLTAIEEFERVGAFSNCTDAVQSLLQRTRVDRGLPAVVEDPAVVGRVASIAARSQHRGGAE